MNCKNCKKQGCSLAGKIHEMSFECKAYVGKTNADKLRSMSDEELAKWLNHMQADAYNRGMLEDWIFGYPNNYDNWLDWLREEAEDD